MQLIVKGRNIEVNDHLRSYVDKKIGKLDRILPDTREIRVELSEQSSRKASQRHVAQVTVRSDTTLLRAEERSGDMFAAIDAATDKLYRQVRRYKGKRRRKIERAQVAAVEEEWNLDEEELEEESEFEEELTGGRIVRTKRFPMLPMSEDEAIDQMELLGHDFFVFFNPADAGVNVVYRRSDGDYGLLQPEIV